MAAAAYRSGSKLFDERTGKLHHYENRKGVLDTFLVLPENTDTAYTDRAFLWNSAEQADNRKNSRTARELVLALPHELSDVDRQALTRDMAGWLMERYRVAVDAAIHKPIEEHSDDPRNHHAHILFSTRTLTPSGFSNKTRVLDDRKTGAEETELIREVWETLANDALKQAGHTDIQIDRRSLEEQGIDRIPEIHTGSDAREALDDREHTSNSNNTSKEDSADSGSDEEEEDEGDKEGSTTSSGGLAPSHELEPAEELDAIVSGESQYQYKENETLSRRDLNKEIKRINALRMAYSDIPLTDQIKDLDQLMERLDARVQHLETLAERSSLSSSLKKTLLNSMSELIALSQEILTTKEANQAALALSAKEKEARRARQLKRYGRTYRAGIHSQIREMKQNLSILKTKQAEYQKYKGLVDVIDLHTHTVTDKGSLSRHTTNQESSLKIALQAKHMRETIPTEFRSQSRQDNNSPKTNINNTKTHIRNGQSRTISSTQRITKNRPPENKYLSTQVKVKTEGLSTQKQDKPRASFASAVKIEKKILSQSNPSWRTPPKEGVAPFDPTRKAQATKSTHRSEPKKPERSSWVIPNGEKMDPLTEAIRKKQAQTRQESREYSPKQPEYNRSTGKGQFNAQSDPKSHNRTTRDAHRAKTSAEAEASRERTPPEYRADPYSPEEDVTPNSSNESLKDKVQSRFKDAAETVKEKWHHFRGGSTDSTHETPNKPRPTMSSGFNSASFEGRDKSDMNEDHKPQSREPMNE